jgi:hypothetical protein
VGSTVVLGSFSEARIDAMSCSTLSPEVEMITWGDGSTTTVTGNCDLNSNTPGSSCWLTAVCNPPTGCTFSLFAPGHVYAEEGAYSGSFFWNDPNGATLQTTAITATVTDAPLGNATGGSITASQQQPFTGATVATFTDANPGDHSADMSGTIDWGDGTATATCGPASAGDPCVISYAAGVYSVIAGHTSPRPGRTRRRS